MSKKYLALEREAVDLLEPGLPYSDVTMRRAFIVWVHCGADMEFRCVCKYYHRLECLESTYPLNRKAMSRRLELDLFSNRPPSSQFLNEAFPRLYRKGHAHALLSKIEGIRNEQFIFNLQGFENVDIAGSSKKDILNASRMVRRFCKERHITPTTFLMTFKMYLKICHLVYSINNIIVYIKKKAIKAEIELQSNMPQDYDFLHIDEIDVKNITNIKNITKKESAKPNVNIDDNLTQNDMLKKNVEDVFFLPSTPLDKTQTKLTPKQDSSRNDDQNNKTDDSKNYVRIYTDYKDVADTLVDTNRTMKVNPEKDLESRLNDDGIKVTILKRNTKNNEQRVDLNETYNNIVKIKSRTILFSG